MSVWQTNQSKRSVVEIPSISCVSKSFPIFPVVILSHFLFLSGSREWSTTSELKTVLRHATEFCTNQHSRWSYAIVVSPECLAVSETFSFDHVIDKEYTQRTSRAKWIPQTDGSVKSSCLRTQTALWDSRKKKIIWYVCYCRDACLSDFE